MSRRALATATFAATALLVTGVVPLGGAHAAACLAWTDAATDVQPAGFAAPVPAPGLDVVAASFATNAEQAVAKIKVADLGAKYSLAGDHFNVSFRLANVSVLLLAERSEVGDSASVADSMRTLAAPAVADFDLASDTVTITAPISSINTVIGKPSTDLEASAIVASTMTLIAGGKSYVSADDGSAGEAKYVFGTACDTAPSPGVIPAPAVDCTPNFTDVADDGTPKGPGGAGTSNDASLDVRSVVLNSTPQHLMAYITVTTLADKPANYQGDRFEIGFKAGTKTYTYSVGRAGLGRSLNMPPPTRGTVNGAADDKLAVRGVFGQPKNTVVILIDRAGLDAVNGSPVADGTTLTDVVVTTAGAQPGMYLTADTAQATAATERVYQVGNNPCFGPPKSKLVNTGAVTTQFGDPARVAAKLTTEAGDALAGKTVRFELGAVSATATTNDSGVAEAMLTSPLVAGAYNLVASFAGDASAKTSSLTTPFTIAQEKTKITLSVVKSGTKRTVTAKLLDDDGKPVVGQPVTWSINNKAAGTPKTNSSGAVTLTTAKPTQTVKAVFAAVAGKYAGSTASVKV